MRHSPHRFYRLLALAWVILACLAYAVIHRAEVLDLASYLAG